MLIVDQFISEKILQLSKHYTENIATRFLRPIFSKIFSDLNLMHNISDLTEHSPDFIMQGQRIADLYNQIFSMANFIFLVRRDILPNIYNLAKANTQNAGADKVYRIMAFNSLPTNIDILAKMLAELYDAVANYDRTHSTKGRPVYSQFQQSENFHRMLGLT